jgi:hypothetical protein
MAIACTILASVPVFGQEKLYPVRGNDKAVPAILTPDRSGFVVEKAFEHKLIVAFPTDKNVSFVPDTDQMIVLWLRIQNVSPRPIRLDIAKFIATDDEGRTFAGLAPDEVANRIIAGGATAATLGSKTLRGISLGRVANKPTDEQLREDIQRYSLHSGEIAAGSVKEGLIYFERPAQKNFTVQVVLGSLWSRPLVFSTEKQK